MYYTCSPFEYMRKVHFGPRMMEKFREQFRFSFPLEVMDRKDSYAIKALLPGLSSEEVTIEVKENQLFIAGETKPSGEETAEYLLREIPYGKFSRTILLPTAVNSDQAQASMLNGILTIEIPKADEAKPRTVKINK